ncbi:hypothetical protein [Dongia sedimenti]|uniref:Uncharacterized protein n=1 Tax=Dongia sedimenti TaxID=3064282 RepID=A0ABU0YGS0_9PROT|nr:hypothetical protein [Rhodospirillaceae bacterium R-7]
MNKVSLTRGALFGAACAVITLAAGSAGAQTYPPGTNCQSLLPGLRANCIDQARSMNSGTNVIPNSAGSNTVQSPGTNSLNSGTNVSPSGVAPTTVAPSTVAPSGVTTNGTASPNAVTPNGTVSPNAVTPNGTINPNTVSPNGTVSPNAVGTPNSAAPAANPVILPPAATGTGAGGATGGTSDN